MGGRSGFGGAWKGCGGSSSETKKDVMDMRPGDGNTNGRARGLFLEETGGEDWACDGAVAGCIVVP